MPSAASSANLAKPQRTGVYTPFLKLNAAAYSAHVGSVWTEQTALLPVEDRGKQLIKNDFLRTFLTPRGRGRRHQLEGELKETAPH